MSHNTLSNPNPGPEPRKTNNLGRRLGDITPIDPFSGFGACCCDKLCVDSKTFKDCDSFCFTRKVQTCWRKNKQCWQIDCPSKDPRKECPNKSQSCCLEGECVNVGQGEEGKGWCEYNGGTFLGYGRCGEENCTVQQDDKSARNGSGANCGCVNYSIKPYTCRDTLKTFCDGKDEYCAAESCYDWKKGKQIPKIEKNQKFWEEYCDTNDT